MPSGKLPPVLWRRPTGLLSQKKEKKKKKKQQQQQQQTYRGISFYVGWMDLH